MNEAFFTDLSAWLTQAGLAGTSETDVVSGLCDRCVAAGLPLARTKCLSTRCIPSTRVACFAGVLAQPKLLSSTMAVPPRTRSLHRVLIPWMSRRPNAGGAAHELPIRAHIRPVRACRAAASAVRLDEPRRSAGKKGKPGWRHGISPFGDLKYPSGFKQFDYVNAKAPKGGAARQIALGTYDNFNMVVDGVKGALAVGIDLIYDTLLVAALDEVSSGYGLLAEAVSYPDDFSSASFKLRAEAKWHDGTAVTPEDVIFSFEMFKKLSPQAGANYQHVAKAEKVGRSRGHLYLRWARPPKPAAGPGATYRLAEGLVGRDRCGRQKAGRRFDNAGSATWLRSVPH